MADNVQINAGPDDSIRTKDRSGVETQIVGLDIGIGTATEKLMQSGQQTMADSIPVVLASDQSAFTVTANAGTNLNTSALALEAGGNLAAVAASLSVLDDWDETDRAKVNVVVGQAGITAGAGAVAAHTPRVTLASDDPAVTALQILDNAISGSEMQVDIVSGTVTANQGGTWTVQPGNTANTTPWLVTVHDGTTAATVRNLAANDALNVAIVDAAGDQITSFGGGTQYTEGDTDATITGTAMLMEGAANALVVAQGTAADGLLVNLGTNNDVTVTGTVTANAGTGPFPVSDNSGSLTVDAPMGTPVNVQVGDGSNTATIRNLAANDALNVAIVDGAGDQITSFGGGTQYTEGDTDASITGTAALWEDTSDTLRAVSMAKPLPIQPGTSVTFVVTQSTAANLNVTEASAAAIKTAVEIMDDWDETDRAKVNLIAGQAGIAGGTGADGANVPRVTLATDIALPAGNNNIGDVDVLTLPGTAAEGAALPAVFVVAAGDDGTDTQPLQLSAGGDLKVTLDSETVAATQSGTWTVQPGNTANTTPWLASIHDGTTKATVRDLAANDALNVAIVDGAGDQITSFGGGTQYTEGDTDASITGTAALWEDAADTLRAVSMAKPLPVQPGTSIAFPVTDNSGSLTVDAPVGTPVNVQVGDGTTTATIRNLAANDALNVAIVDGAGDQITSFGGGTQYTEGDTDASITGTAAMWEDTSDTLRAVSLAKALPVQPGTGAVFSSLEPLSSTDDFSRVNHQSSTTAGDKTIITGVGGQTIKVYGLIINSSVANTIAVKSGASTAMLVPLAFGARGMLVLDLRRRPYFVTTAGDALVMNKSGAGGVLLTTVWYIQS